MAQIRGTITRKSNGSIEFTPIDAAAFGTLPDAGAEITLQVDRPPRESIITTVERETGSPAPGVYREPATGSEDASRPAVPPQERRRR